jgi:hypothetical protein
MSIGLRNRHNQKLFKFSDRDVELVQVICLYWTGGTAKSGLSEFERAVLSAIAEPKPPEISALIQQILVNEAMS